MSARSRTAAAHNAHPERRHAEGAENYAKAIYQLQAGGEQSVGTGAVAERLGTLPITASRLRPRVSSWRWR